MNFEESLEFLRQESSDDGNSFYSQLTDVVVENLSKQPPQASRTFESSFGFLCQESSDDGSSLYDHLIDVVVDILSKRQPPQASCSFESISAAIRNKRITAAKLIEASPVMPISSQLGTRDSSLRVNDSQSQQLLQEMTVVPDDEQRLSEADGVQVPEILRDAQLWSLAGLSFGDSEVDRIYLCIRELAGSLSPENYDSLRFWGCITTLKCNYFVVEGRNSEMQLEKCRASEEVSPRL